MRDPDNFNRLEERAWRTESEMAVIEDAQNGDPNAQYQLGVWHYKGGAQLVEKDIVKALKWLEKACLQGHKKAQALFEEILVHDYR